MTRLVRWGSPLCAVLYGGLDRMTIADGRVACVPASECWWSGIDKVQTNLRDGLEVVRLDDRRWRVHGTHTTSHTTTGNWIKTPAGVWDTGIVTTRPDLLSLTIGGYSLGTWDGRILTLPQDPSIRHYLVVDSEPGAQIDLVFEPYMWRIR